MTDQLPEPISDVVPPYPYRVSVSQLSEGFTLTWVCFPEGKAKQGVVNWDIPKNINPLTQALKSCRCFENNYDSSMSEPRVEEGKMSMP